MSLKHDLAHRVVSRIHEPAAAQAAREHFQRVVQRKEVPEDIAEIEVVLAGRAVVKLFEVLVEAKLAPSKSEARRLVQQGAVSVDRERVDDPTRGFESGSVLIQVGKRRFARVVIRPC